MKKALCLLFSLLLLTPAFAGGKIILKSGEPSVLSVQENAVAIFDYSKAEIEGKDLSLEDYVDQKGYKFAEKWERAQELAHKDFVKRYNKKSNGLTLSLSKKEKAKYQFVVQVRTIDLGNTAKSLLPIGRKTEGGATLIGRIIVKDASGTELCVLRFTDVKGMGTAGVEGRMLFVYQELQKALMKYLKKNTSSISDEDNENKDEDDDEEETNEDEDEDEE